LISLGFAQEVSKVLQLPGQAMGMAFDFVFVAIFIFIIVIVVVVFALAASSRGRIQRPISETTAFPPPPPPDTVMVKCEFCGTQQMWKETCVKCGAPLPKPKLP